jgi:hypothetical protein
MRGWGTPVAVSFVLHGAMAASLVLMPAERDEASGDAEPIEIEIVHTETPEPEPEPVLEPEPEPEVKAETREKPVREKRREVVPPAGPDTGDDDDEEETGTGGAIVEGTGPVVGPPTGKTRDGRDLSTLDLSAKIAVPKFEDQGPGVVLELEQKDPKRRGTSDGGWTYEDSAFGAHVAADGSVTFDGRGNSAVDGIPELGMSPGSDNEAPSAVGKWTIDLNDWILSAGGDDPYSYEKRRFLEATREERLAMARAACGERLSAALVDLPQRLTKIWRSRRSPEEKREVLFDLWDDCAEEGAPEVMRYGELARLTILDFIQKHLPEGSAEAYTELEIDRFNERRLSSRPFSPYGGKM